MGPKSLTPSPPSTPQEVDAQVSVLAHRRFALVALVRSSERRWVASGRWCRCQLRSSALQATVTEGTGRSCSGGVFNTSGFCAGEALRSEEIGKEGTMSDFPREEVEGGQCFMNICTLKQKDRFPVLLEVEIFQKTCRFGGNLFRLKAITRTTVIAIEGGSWDSMIPVWEASFRGRPLERNTVTSPYPPCSSVPQMECPSVPAKVSLSRFQVGGASLCHRVSWIFQEKELKLKLSMCPQTPNEGSPPRSPPGLGLE